MSIYETLLKLGAKVLVPLKLEPDRFKVSGRMWGGETKLTYNGFTYGFILWYHGPDNDLSLEEANEHLSLKSIETDTGTYYDTYWYTRVKDGHLLLHPVGWFASTRNREDIPDSEFLQLF